MEENKAAVYIRSQIAKKEIFTMTKLFIKVYLYHPSIYFEKSTNKRKKNTIHSWTKYSPINGNNFI